MPQPAPHRPRPRAPSQSLRWVRCRISAQEGGDRGGESLGVGCVQGGRGVRGKHAGNRGWECCRGSPHVCWPHWRSCLFSGFLGQVVRPHPSLTK
jgi:hypothetical protein